MQTLAQIKENETTPTPLLLFDCTMNDGSIHLWCTQRVKLGDKSYDPRVCKNNLFEIQTASDQGVDTIPKVTLDLANADSVLSEIERETGFKGGRLTCSFVFYDTTNQVALADPMVLFQGIFNSPESITESIFRVSAVNRLSAQRVVLPSQRVQRRCSWDFPTTQTDRTEAVSGGLLGERSRFYACGYSADIPGGVGDLNNGNAYTDCSFTRSDCEARGMFSKDSRGQTTSRFSGIEFVPSTITVRSAGEKGSHLSPVSLNETKYNDFISVIYGTAWHTPSIVFARNDGNLTRIEVLLGVGEMQEVHQVLVNDIEIPLGHSGQNLTGTGWFNVVTLGGRNGAFNLDFKNASGAPLGDPYGGLAYLSVVVPNRINDGSSLPEIKVLLDGLKLSQYDSTGASLPKLFTNNPVWIILDVLLRNGWDATEIDVISFAQAAAYCDHPISASDLNGNAVQIPRFQCNLVLKSRRSAGDVLRGIRNASRLFLTFGSAGLLQLRNENTTAAQQTTKSSFTNATEQLDGGWAAYEFGDGTLGTSGIIRNTDGTSTLRVTSRSSSDTPNRMSVEFQDSFNEYQQDSFSLSDPDDISTAGQEINSAPAVLGLPNYNQAARTLQFLLSKSVDGNVQVEFQTSVKALGLTPGDIIALTYLREGFERQPFRVIKIAPGQNFRTATITAQIHDDSWYSDVVVDNFGTGRRLPSARLGIPRPLSGVVTDDAGILEFSVVESSVVAQDGTAAVLLNVGVETPPPVADQAPSIPIVSLKAEYTALVGGLSGGTILYYALSGVDATGNEGPLSFTIRAFIPAGASAYSVTLNGLSFTSDTVSFNVYRGASPVQLNRVASNVTVAGSFVDTGFPPLPLLPPDANFDHSNLYWRLESESEVNALIHSAVTIGNAALQMIASTYSGFAVRIVRGLGAGQERLVLTNSQTDLTLTSAWDIEPDASSTFVISESSFQLGATGPGDRFQFEVPNREGTVVQILGRSANAAGAECPAEISPLTRWKIGGAGVRSVDADVSGVPIFALSVPASPNGTLQVDAVGFSALLNTSSIVGGTLSLYAQDELSDAAPLLLSSALAAADTSLQAAGQKDTFLRLDQEVIYVEDISTDGSLTITRGLFGTIAASYNVGEPIIALRKNVTTFPFIHNFFGTPASGDWSYTILLESARIAAADFYVTNSQGNSPITSQAYTSTLDRGLRTLSGGQYSFQIAGPLAVQDSAVPEIVLDASHVVGSIVSYLGEAAAGSGVQLQLNVNDAALCTLNFDDGSTVSHGVRGADLPALRQGDRLSLDIQSIGSVLPGTDLTVVIVI